MVPHAREIAPSLAGVSLIDAKTALARLMQFENRMIDLSGLGLESTGQGRYRLSGQANYIAGDVDLREVWFPLAPGVLVPAWSLVVFTEGSADWYAVVDAQTGDVLWRKNMRNYASAHDARFRVYVQADGVTPAESPAPMAPSTVTPGSGTQAAGIAPMIVSMHAAMDAIASPNGWIDDCPGGRLYREPDPDPWQQCAGMSGSQRARERVRHRCQRRAGRQWPSHRKPRRQWPRP